MRGKDKTRGDIDDALGKFSLTLVDTLDSLVVMGFEDEFLHSVQRVIVRCLLLDCNRLSAVCPYCGVDTSPPSPPLPQMHVLVGWFCIFLSIP